MKVKNSHKPVVVNHRTKTIVVTNSFMRAATDPSSAEFEMYMKLTAECPDYKVVYTKPRKVKKDDRPPKLTYKRMEVTIQSTPNNTPSAPPRKAATMASKEETP